MDRKIKYIVGIDEVGRGPIAGPVSVCAFMLPITDYQLQIEKWKEETGIPLRDSKKLSKKQREEWFKFLKKQKEEENCNFVVSFVSSSNIDKFGIAKCIQKALDSSLYKIASSDILFLKSSDEGDENQCQTSKKEHQTSLYVFLDGGLRAPLEFVNQETVIKGDELHPIISFASIVAKVSRDKVMENFSKQYKDYGFEKHSGYGTKAHYEAIKKHGPTPIHRKSFIH